jgi:hypothetical protein
MEKMVAFCGLVCSECPAYIATQRNDNGERKKVAEDINCDGCLAESDRLLGFCQKCEIRKCGQEKGVANCAYCDDYGCEKLTKFFNMAPVAKTNLEEIRKNL